jgi:hypothetical protein
MNTNPSKSGVHWEGATYLRVEKPRFLFLEGSGGAAGVPVIAAVAPAGVPAALAGASAARAASSTDRPAADALALAAGTCSIAASATRGDGGEGSHLSGAAYPPSLSSSSSSSDDEFSGVARGASPCCSRNRYSSLSRSRCSRRWIPFSFLRVARSCSHHYAARVPALAGASVGLNARHPRSPSANGTC